MALHFFVTRKCLQNSRLSFSTVEDGFSELGRRTGKFSEFFLDKYRRCGYTLPRRECEYCFLTESRHWLLGESVGESFKSEQAMGSHGSLSTPWRRSARLWKGFGWRV